MVDFSMYEEQVHQVYCYKCPQCGKLDYPAPMLCKNCSQRRDPSGIIYPHWEKIPLEGKCRLLGWTRVYALPEGFEVKYLLFGIVEFENGLRASGRLLVDKPETGMALVSRTGVVKEIVGKDIYGLMFEAGT